MTTRPTPTPTPPADEHEPLVRILREGARRAHDLSTTVGVLVLVGATLALAGTWLFGEIADKVLSGATQQFDDAVLTWLGTLHRPWLDTVALEVTSLGNGTVVFVIAGVAALFLWLTRHRYSSVLLLAASAGGIVVSLVLKGFFQRPRPQVIEWGTQVVTSSFPSGHATTSAVVYATVAYLAARLQRRRWTRVVTLVAATIFILAIALSRLYLGVHYPTDVAAGMVAGLAWAGFCMAVLEAVQRFILRHAPTKTAHELPAPNADTPDELEAGAAGRGVVVER